MMSGARMVHLRTVHTSFHARVIAARLGADGIITQLRGSVDGPYPVGDVSVWVAEDDAECASELLLADEIEAAFDLAEEGEPWDRRGKRPLVLGLSGTQLLAALGIVLLLWSAVLARILG
jgi:hypothetical protein